MCLLPGTLPGGLAPRPGPSSVCFQDGVAERALHCQSRGWVCPASPLAHSGVLDERAPSPLCVSLSSQGRGRGTPGVRGCSQQEINQKRSFFSHNKSRSRRRGWGGSFVMRTRTGPFLSLQPFAVLDFVLILVASWLKGGCSPLPCCLSLHGKKRGRLQAVFPVSGAQKFSQFMS